MNLVEENKRAKAIMEKFVNKCRTGRARSVETYAEMTTWLANRKERMNQEEARVDADNMLLDPGEFPPTEVNDG